MDLIRSRFVHSLPTTFRRAVASPLFVFLLAAVTFGISTRGRLQPSPDMKFYVRLADAVSKGHFDVFTTSKQANFTVIVFPSLLAVVRMISPAHWQSIMLGINVLCAAVTAMLLVKLVRMVTGSDAAATIALLFYLVCFDVLVWVRFLETDSLYTAIATAAFLLVVRGVLYPDGPQGGRRTKVALTTILAAVTRPVGVVVIPLVILAEWFFVQREEKRGRRVLWILVGFGIVATFFLHAYLYQDSNRWPSDWMRPKLQESVARERGGEVVWDRHETFHQPPSTMSDYLSIEADRFVRFFQITSSGFSRTHNLIAIAYYGPLFLLALIGTVDALRSADRRRSAVVQVALLWIIAAAALSAVTILDFDWRYRLPLIPQIILLGACGADSLLRRFAR
jgi:4-amino-4-deoxy-L-arabinose transferase-like glycosyltransferase